MTLTKRMVLTIGIAPLALAFVSAQTAGADPASPDRGCHGYYTTQAKGDDRGVQGSAIGGLGASDGSTTDGQAHSDDGRGAILQAFLDQFCR